MTLTTKEISELEAMFRAALTNPESCKEYGELFLEAFTSAMGNQNLSKKFNGLVKDASGFPTLVKILQAQEKKIEKLEESNRILETMLHNLTINTDTIGRLFVHYIKEKHPPMFDEIQRMLREDKDMINAQMGKSESATNPPPGN